MKRFHIHTTVADLPKSIAFYSQLFAAEPTRVEADYAKWMLDDPRVNFAISTRGSQVGVDHLGIQTETEEELSELRARAIAAGMALLDEGETNCCYARSDKYWLQDPQGLAWEGFRTLGDVPMYGGAAATGAVAQADDKGGQGAGAGSAEGGRPAGACCVGGQRAGQDSTQACC